MVFRECCFLVTITALQPNRGIDVDNLYVLELIPSDPDAGWSMGFWTEIGPTKSEIMFDDEAFVLKNVKLDEQKKSLTWTIELRSSEHDFSEIVGGEMFITMNPKT